MLKFLGAIMTLLGSASGSNDGRAPIYLSSEPVDGGVRIQVIGAPASDYEAAFRLEVSSPSGQSQHSGSARFRTGEKATLSTVTVGVPPKGSWRARLWVEPTKAEPYEQTAGSPAG